MKKMITVSIDPKHILLTLLVIVILAMPVLSVCVCDQTAFANGNTVTYTYDDAGRLTSVDYPKEISIDYTYDTMGNLLSKDVSGGEWSPLAYDADHSGQIEFGEMVFALMDYLASEITFNQMVSVLMYYLTG